jgi:hypothetical protein
MNELNKIDKKCVFRLKTHFLSQDSPAFNPITAVNPIRCTSLHLGIYCYILYLF